VPASFAGTQRAGLDSTKSGTARAARQHQSQFLRATLTWPDHPDPEDRKKKRTVTE